MIPFPNSYEIILPPGISLINTQKVLHFSLKVSNLIYLNVNKSSEPMLRVKWWGQNKLSYIRFKDKSAIESYPIYSSRSNFLQYFGDMTVLPLEICQARQNHTILCKALLNSKILDGWQGQLYETELDLINNRKKVGEISVSIQIVQKSNPHYQKTLEEHREDSQLLAKPLPSITKPSLIKSRNENSAQKSHTQSQIHRPPHNILEDSSESLQIESIPRNKQKNPQELIRQQFGSCVCSRIKNCNEETQLLKLHEDYQMIFGIGKQSCEETTQSIELEFVKWVQNHQANRQNPKNSSVIVVQFPLPSKRINRYELRSNQGSIIKIIINNREYTETQMQEYVKQAFITVQVDQRYSGSVSLGKMLSNCGTDVFVALSECKGKKNVGGGIRGHCQMKIVPPRSQNQPQKSIKNDDFQKKPLTNSQDKKETNKMRHEYAWIFINQFNSLQSALYQNSNIFIRLVSDEKESIQTQTIWKCANPEFKYIVTVEQKPKYILELWDRQKKPLLIGLVQFDSNFKWEQNFPVINLRSDVIGYLSLCIGSGSLIDANKFLQLHMRKKTSPQEKQVQKEPENKFQLEQQSRHELSHQSGLEQESRSEHESFSNKENVIDGNNRFSIHINHHANPLQQSFSLLQIHNFVFTKMLNQESIDPFDHRSLKLSQFQQLINGNFSKLNQPGLPIWAISKLASFYLEPESNRINMENFVNSFQAFKMYYRDLQEFRDQIVRQFIGDLEKTGITINLLETYILSANRIWERMGEMTGNRINIQKMRIYYESCPAVDFCDKMRKFQVYEETFGDPLPQKELKQYITDQLCDVLDVNPSNPRFREYIKQAEIDLSKWEELNIFQVEDRSPQVKKPNIIKCPTFGLLGLESMPENLESDRQSHNPSIMAQISPIYANQSNGLYIIFSNFDEVISKLVVNGVYVSLSGSHENQLNLVGVNRQFRYDVVLELKNGMTYETEGAYNEWMGLVDYSGEYGGCLKITKNSIYP